MKWYIGFDEKNFSPLSPLCVGAKHWWKGMKEKPAIFIATLCTVQG